MGHGFCFCVSDRPSLCVRWCIHNHGVVCSCRAQSIMEFTWERFGSMWKGSMIHAHTRYVFFFWTIGVRVSVPSYIMQRSFVGCTQMPRKQPQNSSFIPEPLLCMGVPPIWHIRVWILPLFPRRGMFCMKGLERCCGAFPCTMQGVERIWHIVPFAPC